MTERKKLSLTKPDQAAEGQTPKSAHTPDPRKAPVRGSGSAPRKRLTAAEAALEREEAAARAARDAEFSARAREERGSREQAPPRGQQREERDPRRGAYQGQDRRPNAPYGQQQPRQHQQRPPSRDQAYGDQRHDPRRDHRPDNSPFRQDHRRADGSGNRPRHEPQVYQVGHQAPQEQARSAPDDGRVRLSKLMSERGLSSRREADDWIEQGWVRVNGEVIDELGTRVEPTVEIAIDSMARQQQAERMTILINKPIGYVSGQAEDGYEPAIVLIRPENRWAEDKLPVQLTRGHLRHLAPAGRLDIDSTGLLVLTQDGRVAKQLIGEDSGVEKEYLVRVEAVSHPDAENVSAVVPTEVMERLRFGLELDGRQLRPAQVSWQNEQQLRFVLREGRKRQIRRMCELVGLKVVGLKRVRMGSITLGKLPVGEWRFLRPDERF